MVGKNFILGLLAVLQRPVYAFTHFKCPCSVFRSYSFLPMYLALLIMLHGYPYYIILLRIIIQKLLLLLGASWAWGYIIRGRFGGKNAIKKIRQGLLRCATAPSGVLLTEKICSFLTFLALFHLCPA